uniref:Major facilitator superfamily (MFS) profile domain-containing protein n=1 Tax=Clytia hemisphaerica TaxID=252671 RepID=A0A7M5UN05_9CNID
MLPAIISTLVYTSWSNRIGLKRVMILPMIGGTILTITLILNSYFEEWPLELLLIGSFLDGCFGQFVAIIASIYSYAADVTSIEGRTKRTVILESMMFLGGVVSSAISGILLQKYGFIPTFLLVLAMFAFQMIYWCFLQESYPPRPDQPKISFCQILKGEH